MHNPFVECQFLISAAQLSQLPPPDRPEVAFAGRSNAGKSSALNAICGRKNLARVSKTPGRTQLLNFFDSPAGACLVDLPGYGYAEVPRRVRGTWGHLIGGYVEQRHCLRGIVLVMDIRHPLTEFDRQMLAWAQSYGRPCHILLTKSDKLGFGASKGTLQKVQKELADSEIAASVQLFSAEDGTGVDAARLRIASWLELPAAGKLAAPSAAAPP